jgi:hypothetical protein
MKDNNAEKMLKDLKYIQASVNLAYKKKKSKKKKSSDPASKPR